MTNKQLCHCDLSGEFHVVDDKTCCEVCVAADRQPINADTVEKLLNYLQERKEVANG